MAARPSSDTPMRPAASRIRSIPWASGRLSPDSVVTRPTGKNTTPAIRPATATAAVAARQNTAVVNPLLASRRVRPAGRVSR